MRSRARLGAGIVATVVATAIAAWSATAAGASSQSATGAQPAAAAKHLPAAAVDVKAANAKIAVGKVVGGKAEKKPQGGIDPAVAATAKRFGLSPKRLEQGLFDVKRYMSAHPPAHSVEEDLQSPTVLAVFAKSVGVSTSRAKAIVKFLLAEWRKTAKPTPDDLTAAAAKFLSARLHISLERAARIWAQVEKIARNNGGIEPNDPAVVALARSVGLTPKQFMTLLADLKMSVGGSPGKPAPPGKKPPAKK